MAADQEPDQEAKGTKADPEASPAESADGKGKPTKAADPAASIQWQSQTPDGNVLLSLPWEIFVLGVSILSIVNLTLLVLLRNDSVEQVVVFMDLVLVLIFALDLLRRLHIATDRRAYMIHGWGWLDAISVIPMLRIARLLRIARVYRVVKRMGGGRAAFRVFFRDRATGGLLLVMLIAIIVLEFGSLAILAVEIQDPDGNIKDAGDALWYTLVSMSTVGYGDRYPVTSLGRLIGSGIIIVGVGVFGTLTGFLANAFLAPRKD
jgi:voltage-gated potassium channel